MRGNVFIIGCLLYIIRCVDERLHYRMIGGGGRFCVRGLSVHSIVEIWQTKLMNREEANKAVFKRL